MSSSPDPNLSSRRRLPRGVRILLRVLAGIVGTALAVVVLVAILLAIPAVREGVLREALARANQALPGTIEAHVSWGSWDDLRLVDILWTADGDTLAQAAHLGLGVEVSPLFRKDVVVTHLELTGVRANVPAIERAMPEGEPSPPEPETSSGPPPFPRPGSVPGVPSVAVDRLVIGVDEVWVDSTTAVRNLRLRASADLRAGRAPALTLDTLTVAVPAQDATLRQLRVDADRQTVRGGGDLRIGGWPIGLDLTGTIGDRQGTLSLVARDLEPEPADTAGLDLDLRWQTVDDGLELEAEGTIWVPSSTRFARDPLLSALGQLERTYAGPEVRFDARARVGGAIHASAEVTIPPLDWFDGARLTARVHPDSGATATAEATVRDVHLVADAKLGEKERSVRAELTVRGTRWTEILPDSLRRTIDAQLDSLAVRLVAEARDFGEGPELDASLTGRATTPAGTLDSLSVTADRDAGAAAPVRVGIRAGGFDHVLATRGEVRGIPGLDANDEAPLEVRLAPIRILDLRSRGTLGRPAEMADPEVPTRPTLRVDPDETTVAIDELRVTGDYGDVTVGGAARSQGRSEVSIGLAWPEPPLVVLALAPADSTRDAIHAAWTTGDPTRLDLQVEATRDSAGIRATVDGDIALPGPQRFAALMPAARLEGLGPITGSLRADVEQSASADSAAVTRYRGWLDLGETAWIDTLRVDAHGAQGSGTPTAVLDTVAVVIGDLALGGAIQMADTLEGGVWLRLRGLDLVRRIVPTLEDDASASLDLDVRLAGTAEKPDVTADLRADARLAAVVAPSIEGRFRLRDGRLDQSRLRVGPVDAGATRIDSLVVAYAPDPERMGLLAGRAALDVGALDIGLHHEIELTSLLDEREPGVVEIVTDSLSLRLLDDELHSQGPFRVRVVADSGLVVIDDLDLRGTLGMIRASGESRPSGGDLTLEARLTPKRPEAFSGMAGVWPSALTVRLDELSDRALSLDVGAEGMSVSSRDDLTFDLRVRGENGVVDARLQVADADTAHPMVDLDAMLPATWTRIPFSLTRVDSALTVDLTWNELPLPNRMDQAALGRYLDGEEPDQEPRTTGHVHLKGSPASPTVEASTTVSFHGWPRLERDVIRASARSDGEGVGLEVTLVHDSTRVLTLEGRSGPFSVASGTSPLPDGTPIDLTLTSEPIDLGRFSPLLPPSVDVSGRLEIDATVKGDMPDLSLEGRLEARTVEVSLADGSRVTAEASIQLGGRTTAPTLSGEVRIPQAVILIPEEAPNLLPAEGTAVLWEETSFAAGDSLETAPRTPRPAPMTLPEGTTIDLTIRIPSRFLIRGRGLDVEMAGELQVELEEGMPTPVGSLRPVSGRLNLLGRTFRIDEGSVTFFGQDAVDPALDLGLRLDLSGTEFRVRVTGTAQAPELALSSTPEMPEGDILSFLLFGQRMDDLDSGQMGLLQDRTLDIAQSYAAARLEAAIGQRLGVDLVQIEDSLEEDEATTLTVGKYLSPKALVKLEQELGGSGGSALHLEYQLIRQLFLETFVSRELSSGAEVSWSKDY